MHPIRTTFLSTIAICHQQLTGFGPLPLSHYTVSSSVLNPPTHLLGMPPTVRPTTTWSSAASSGRNPASSEPKPASAKLRKLVNTIKFVGALSRKGRRGPNGTNGVREGGIHKATNKAFSSSFSSSFGPFSRPLHGSWIIPEKEPDAAAVIPLTWGIVDKLISHFVGPTGVKYLVRCETTVDWLTASSATAHALHIMRAPDALPLSRRTLTCSGRSSQT